MISNSALPVLKSTVLLAQGAMVLAGCILAWRLVFSPAVRANRGAPPLLAWNITSSELMIFLLHAFLGLFMCSAIGGIAAKFFDLTADRLIIVGTLSAHGGLLCGMVFFIASDRTRFAARVGSAPDALSSGLATFLISLPFVHGTGLAWALALKLCGLPVEKQPAVEMLGRISSPLWMVLFCFTAVVVAPLAEELLFRAGIFRFLRTRAPRWIALSLPATLFAAAHVHLASYAQLAVLGLIFALSYERTGNLGTPVVAHAAFNLNNVVLLLSGSTE